MTTEDDDEDALIIVCRDIPGRHTGGPNCFCNPMAFRASEPMEEIERVMAVANKPH